MFKVSTFRMSSTEIDFELYKEITKIENDPKYDNEIIDVEFIQLDREASRSGMVYDNFMVIIKYHSFDKHKESKVDYPFKPPKADIAGVF